jgi:hypothetical protein
MILFHRTGPQSPRTILKSGFVDGPAYSEMLDVAGVWLSDRIMNVRRASCSSKSRMDSQDSELADIEIIEDGKPYREWCVPAVIVNRTAAVRITDSGEQ